MSSVFEFLSEQKCEGAFAYSRGDERVVVRVSIASGVQSDAWDQLKESPLFKDWVERFCPEGRLRLKSVCIQQTQPYFLLGVVAESADGTALSSSVALKKPSAGVLLILRNSDTHLELCIFARKPDLATGMPVSLSLLEGDFDEDGIFRGEFSALVEEALGSPLRRSEATDLQRPLVGSEEASPGMMFATSQTVTCSSKAPDDPRTALSATAGVCSELYLIRRSVPPAFLADLESRLGRTRRLGQFISPAGSDVTPASPTGLSVVYLGDAWRATTDARAVAALFLLVEARYHQVHSKRGPAAPSGSGSAATSRREQRNGSASASGFGSASASGSGSGSGAMAGAGAGSSPTSATSHPRKTAHFSKVSDLTPSTTGVNLRVRVVEAVQPEVDRSLPNGKVIRRGSVRVADETGMITVSLDNAQLDVPGCPGSPLVIRNGKISMVDGRMRLLVDKWGKIGPAGEEEILGFDFTECSSRDMSAVEYELVVYQPNATTAGQVSTSQDGRRNVKTRGGSNARRGGRPSRNGGWSRGGARRG